MKYKTTNAELKSVYNLVSAGYCDLQYALSYISPNAYTASKMYGWRADIYEFDGFTIATGYAPPGHAKRLPYELCKKIDTACRDLNKEQSVELLQREIVDFLKGCK